MLRFLLCTATILVVVLGFTSFVHADPFEDANRAFAAGHYAESST